MPHASTPSFLSRARRAVTAWGVPVAIIIVSLVAYGFYARRPTLQVSRVDNADFRYVAEHFWGVRHVDATYDAGFPREWMRYLDRVPFREILPGTYYLSVDAVRKAVLPWVRTLTLYAIGLKVLLTAALLFFYDACKRRSGAVIAAFAVAAVALPPESWYTTERLLGEPYLRIAIIVASACLIRLVTPTERRRGLVGGILGAMCIVCVHAKSHWILLPIALTPALIVYWYRAALPWRALLPYLTCVLLVPVSLLLVHGIGWGYWHLNGGMALHVSHRTNGSSFIYSCDEIAREGGAIPSNCARQGRDPGFFEMDVNPDVSIEQLIALDRLSRDYLLRDPVALVTPVARWLMRYSLLGEREAFSFKPIGFFMAVLTVACWALYLAGLYKRETALLAYLAAIIILIPSTSVIFDMPNERYYFPVIGIPLAVAVLIASSFWKRVR